MLSPFDSADFHDDDSSSHDGGPQEPGQMEFEAPVTNSFVLPFGEVIGMNEVHQDQSGNIYLDTSDYVEGTNPWLPDPDGVLNGDPSVAIFPAEQWGYSSPVSNNSAAADEENTEGWEWSAEASEMETAVDSSTDHSPVENPEPISLDYGDSTGDWDASTSDGNGPSDDWSSSTTDWDASSWSDDSYESNWDSGSDAWSSSSDGDSSTDW